MKMLIVNENPEVKYVIVINKSWTTKSKHNKIESMDFVSVVKSDKVFKFKEVR